MYHVDRWKDVKKITDQLNVLFKLKQINLNFHINVLKLLKHEIGFKLYS